MFHNDVATCATQLPAAKRRKEADGSPIIANRELYNTETDKLIAEKEKTIAELWRRLTSEQAAAATAVELHDRTKAVVVVKKEKVEGLEDASKCKVCFEQEANVICRPCSHVSTCEACFAASPLGCLWWSPKSNESQY